MSDTFRSGSLWTVLTAPLRWLGRHEFSTMLVGFLLVASVWGFVELADDVMEGDTRTYDERILLMMRNPADLDDPVGPGWLEELGRDITGLGGVGVLSLLTVAVCIYLLLDGKTHAMLLVLTATLGGTLLMATMKHSFDRPRPDLVAHGAEVYTTSFPSGHSMISATTYLTLGALLARFQRRRVIKAYLLILAALLTTLVGISRVYLGVHWPSDVLAGWTAGAAWAMLCWLVARWLQKRGRVEQDASPPPDAPEPR